MPVTDPLQGATFLPAWNEPYQMPQTIADLYQFLLDRAIPRFTTKPELEGLYPSPAAGKMAFADGVLYISNGGGSPWVALWSVAAPKAVTAGANYTSSARSEILEPGWVTLSGALVRNAAPLVRATVIGTLDPAHKPAEGIRRLSVALGAAAPAGAGVSALSITATDGTMTLTADASQLAAQNTVYLDGVKFRITNV